MPCAGALHDFGALIGRPVIVHAATTLTPPKALLSIVRRVASGGALALIEHVDRAPQRAAAQLGDWLCTLRDALRAEDSVAFLDGSEVELCPTNTL